MNQDPNLDVVYVGVDVSSQWLDLAGLGPAQRVANNAAGHTRLLKQLPDQAHVILEASGGYEKALWLTLLRSGRRVSRLNPARVRYFAKACMKLAKTDAIDAALLAEFGRRLQPATDKLPSAGQLELTDLVSRREQLVDARAVQEVQCQQLSDRRLQVQGRRLLRAFSLQIKHLDQLIASLLKTQELACKASRLQQLEGVGPVVSATLLACLPELGQISAPRLASLAGVAPHPDDSGPTKGYRRIQGGRHRVRRALYMASLTCVQCNERCKAFYQRLLQHGKPFKVAITAVMRKLLCLLNRLIAQPNFTLAN